MAAFGAGNPAQELGTVLGNSIATKMDQDIIALFDGFSTSLGSAGTEITAADIFKAAATLRNAKAPGNYVAVLHPFHAYQLSANLTNTFANPNGGDTQNEAMRKASWDRLQVWTFTSLQTSPWMRMTMLRAPCLRPKRCALQ